MEAIPSSKISVITRVTVRHIPEDDILYSYRRENLNSYTVDDFVRGSKQKTLEYISEMSLT
jgi:hypothetical protein